MAALVLVCVLCGILIGSYLTMKIQNEYHPDTNDIIPTEGMGVFANSFVVKEL